MVLGLLPINVFAASEESTASEQNPFAGKTISILGDSISTYTGVSNNTSYSSTIGSNLVYYSAGTLGVYRPDTWWQQTIDALGMELLVNNSWSGSTIFKPRQGAASVAYGDRCVNLHNNAGEEPDVIAVFMGTNDFSYYQSTLGTADEVNYSELIVDNGDGTFAYAVPATSCEAYAIMLHKMTNRYPNTEIFCMTPMARRDPDKADNYADAGQPTQFNAELTEVIEYFDCTVVDLENCGIDKEAEIFDQYMGDGRVHPNAAGMDKITQALVSAMMGEDTTVYGVTSELSNVAISEESGHAFLADGSYSAKLTPAVGFSDIDVTVTMNGVDITKNAYFDGTVKVENITGNLVVSARAVALPHEPVNYLWEFDGLTAISSTANGNVANPLTKLAGRETAGILSGAYFQMAQEVVLQHDQPWIIEWQCSGDWSGMLFSSYASSSTDGNCFLFKSTDRTIGLLAFGERTGGTYHNYGVPTGEYHIDYSKPHIYRVKNQINADGSNMAYLYIDNVSLGAMERYYIGGTSNQNKTVDWINGKDFYFSHIGASAHTLTNCSLEYVQVWEGNHTHSYDPVITSPTCTGQGYTTHTCTICGDSYVDDYVDAAGHSYENGICTGCGAAVSPYLQPLPENIIGCTNLYDLLIPTKGYYTAAKYDTSNGAVLSVVIPVEPGDRIAASSFGSVSENMGSVNGIRVTYLWGDKIVTSLSAGDVYNGYMKNGYITVPDGVDAVCVPWWIPSDSNWLTLRQISKDFTVHIPKAVPAQAPTCTENGYTAGEICEICSASLGSRVEIPATGHDYTGNTCTICGTENVLAILDGKYVSILGDSISTFNGYSNDATVNTTIGGNGPRYDAGAADTKPGSYCLLKSVDDTWWMHFADRSGMNVLVNNSWAGSQVFGGQTSDGRVIPAAYLDRCVNLHDNTLENNPGNAPIYPDVIFVYLGINDYNFNRSKVGNGAVDYAKLVNSDGSYVTPTTFGEAYGILLHKMRNAYPDAQIFAMTLLPENLYSVDKAAWEQHNAYIRGAAEYYDVPLVDLAENCAITWENYSGYMIDKIHPTTAGMKLISDCIETELLAYYKEDLPHAHAYEATITAPTCMEQGYTTYTCPCGDSYVGDLVDALGHDYSAGLCAICGEDTVTASLDGNILTLTGELAEGTRILAACCDDDGRFIAVKMFIWQGSAIDEEILSGEKVRLFFVDENWSPLRQFIPLM